MKMLSGASIVCTLIVSSGAISVSRSITGESRRRFHFLFETRSTRVPIPKATGIGKLDEIPFLRGHVIDGGIPL